MKRKKWWQLLLWIAVWILTVAALGSCSSRDKGQDEGGERSDPYVEYGVTVTEQPENTYVVNGFDLSREEIRIPESIHGIPVVGIEIADPSSMGESKVKTLHLSKSIASIRVTGWELAAESLQVAEDNPVYCSVDGVIYNKEQTKIVWVPKGLTGTVRVPEGVTELSYEVSENFQGCASISELVLPAGMRVTGGAFVGCTSLERLTVPSLPTYEENEGGELAALFSGQDRAEVPSGLKKLTVLSGTVASLNAPSLTTVRLGESVTFGGAVFRNCSSLRELTLPVGLTTFPHELFAGCSSLPSLEIPTTVTDIGSRAFADCAALTALTIPEGVVSIGAGAFDGCVGLENLRFCAVRMEDVPERSNLFLSAGVNGAGLTLTIGKSVTRIPGGLFESHVLEGTDTAVPKLLRVIFEADGVCASVGERAFEGCAELKSVVIGEKVTEIGTYAFRNCETLRSVTLGTAVAAIGFESFLGCPQLVEVINRSSLSLSLGQTSNGALTLSALEIHNGESNLVTVGDAVFYISDHADVGSMLVAYEGRGEELTLPTLSGGLSYGVCGGVFANREDLVRVVIPDFVTTIGYRMFYNCTALTGVSIGKGVKTMGDEAFLGCSALETLYFGAVAMEDLLPLNQTFSGAGSKADKGITVTVSAAVTRIPAYLFDGTAFGAIVPVTAIVFEAGSNCSSIGEEALLDTVYYATDTNWQEGVLYLGTHLMQVKADRSGAVVVREGTTSIAPYAFSGCTEITGVTLPETVTVIGEGAFYGCSKLTAVNIPQKVTVIEKLTLASCPALVTIEGGSGLRVVSKDATTGSDSIATTVYGNVVYRFFTPISPVDKTISLAYFKEGTTTVPYRFFEGCLSLVHVYIPESVETIGDYAFLNVSELIRVLDGRVGRVGGNWKVYKDQNGSKFYLGSSVKGEATTVYLGGVRLDENGFAYVADKQEIVGYFGTKSNITIPAAIDGLTIRSVGEAAFLMRSGLERVVIADGITQVEPYAFAYCNDLDEVLFGTVGVIGEGAFVGCVKLAQIDLGSGRVTHIRADAFRNCTTLSLVRLPATLQIVGAYAFEGCPALATLELPSDTWYVSPDESAGSWTMVVCTDGSAAARMFTDSHAAYVWGVKSYIENNGLA